MNTFFLTKYHALPVGIMFTVPAVILLPWSLWMIYESHVRADSDIQVEAHITGAERRTRSETDDNGRRRHIYDWRYTYRYEHEGRTYTDSFARKRSGEKRRFADGATFQVWIAPDNPAQSTLMSPSARSDLAIFVLVGAVILGGMGGLLLSLFFYEGFR